MSKSLRDEIRTILACSIVGVAFGPAAYAQEQAAAPAPAAQEAQQEEEKATVPEDATADTSMDEIVVTGSRIRRNEFTSPAPVTVITAERSALAGLLSTEEILRGSTVASGQQINDSFSGFVTDGGPGANTISLRGLGAQRTLVLVNGKRWAPSGVQGATNSVDLTAIPSSIISRIEILKDGASSIYGADAVAGVVNVITKESLDGFQLNAQSQITGESDGERYAIDLSWGKVGDRGSISASFNYAEQKAIVAADRGWSRCPTSQRRTDQDGDGNVDNRDPVTGEPLCFGFIYGIGNSALGFARYEPTLSDPTDTTNPFYDPFINGDFGIPFFTRMPESGLLEPGSTNDDPVPLYDNEGEFYRDGLSPGISNIQTPSKIYSFTSFGQLDFDLGGGTSTAYYEAFANKRETDANGGYRQFFPVLNGLTADGNDLHPYNPFAFLEGFGPGFGFAQPVLPSYNLLDPTARIEVERYNVFAGLRGDLAGSWDYDVVVGYGESEGTYRQQQLLDDRVEASLNGIIIDNGTVRCSDAVLAQFPGCVPANLFTNDALLYGTLPQDVLDFIRKDTEGKTTYEGLQFSAFVTGDLFALPAGMVKAVFGAEYREESIDDVPDPDAQANNFWGFTTAGITSGEDKVQELFTEVEVPILTGKPFAEEMYVSLSARYTDYDSYGDDTTYRAAFNYQVTPEVLLRSTFGTSFRAPDLYEQFLGDQTGFISNLNDPCINYGAGSDPGDPLYDNCASLGLPEDFNASSSILSITGGADDLFAETSEALTIGIVLTPRDLDFSIALDYFDIQIEDTVASPSEGFILGECYDSAGFSSAFCSRVGDRSTYIPGQGGQPGSGGELSFVDASFVNIGKQQSRGYDLNIVYEKEFPVGRLILDGTATYLDKQNYELFGEFVRLEGRWGFPRLSARTSARFDWRDWRFSYFLDFIGESEEEPVFDPGTTNQDRQNRTPNLFYHTVSVRYQAADWEAIFSVRNVADKDPPYVSDGQGAEGATRVYNTLPGVGYDLFGRTFGLQLAYRF